MGNGTISFPKDFYVFFIYLCVPRRIPMPSDVFVNELTCNRVDF